MTNKLPPPKNLKEWLSYIEKIHPYEIDLGLERIRKVADRLKLLPLNTEVITVGGTNGKGSCVATLEAILKEAGYSVGAYFSPHLLRYNERVRINGECVTDEALCIAFQAIQQASDEISLTFFEWGTLAALYLFKQAKLDIVVLEVGLGGRLDAVNIVDPDIAIITTIDLDHTQLLGSDRESIGKEKAGIFRAGKPAIYGDLNPPKIIRESAQLLKSPLYCQNTDFGYLVHDQDWEFWYGDSVKLSLPRSIFLLQNVATALMAIKLLQKNKRITNEAIVQGISTAFLLGRFQLIRQNPLVVLDVAHNPQSCRQLYHRLNDSSFNGITYAVMGMMADKDHQESLRSLIELVDQWLVCDLGCARSASASTLVETLEQLKVQKKIDIFDSVQKAYQEALNRAGINDRIIVFGSFFAVAPVLEEENQKL